ncbi:MULTISPECIES: NUDIX hydrolase [Oxalobacteraceae]|uniref:NUDIX hydrolase n=1 Tax=Herminiimonas contaminans TaxID=1111140 RepID=A0ABS0EV14_9BURK|nr:MULTISPECIES: NUDIX hydrolase [Oxalobacteraceae]MBF8178674.1 NUDIX hydrolase [Herminiimonas contaminans]
MQAPVSTDSSKPIPIAAVIAVLIRGDEILLVSRKNPPDVGLWGFPGGKMEFGESLEQAAVRELFEETGVRGVAQQVLTALNAYDRDAQGELRQHFILVAVQCAWQSGEPVAADDAEEAGWFRLQTLTDGTLALSQDVLEVAQMALQAQIIN